jgi:hypothetical protein
MHTPTLAAILMTLAIACTGDAPQTDAAIQQQTARSARVTAARTFTRDCAASHLANWKLRGSAAGGDCRILVVDTSMILEDPIVEAMHYGTGSYELYDGGVLHFSRDRAFRGVAYRDRTGHVWTYGDVTARDAQDLQPCR